MTAAAAAKAVAGVPGNEQEQARNLAKHISKRRRSRSVGSLLVCSQLGVSSDGISPGKCQLIVELIAKL